MGRTDDLIGGVMARLAVVSIDKRLPFSNRLIAATSRRGRVRLCSRFRRGISGLRLLVFITRYFILAVGVVRFRFIFFATSALSQHEC